MSKYTRKKQSKDTPPTDEFVSFWHVAYEKYISPHWRQIAVAVAACIVVLFAVWGIDYAMSSNRETATAELGRALRVYQADLLPADEKAAADAQKDSDVMRYKTVQERADATLKALDDLDKNHGSSDAAHRGAMLRAAALFDLGKFDDAKAAYQKYIDKAPGDDPLTAEAREGVGLCDEAKGNLDAAAQVFDALAKDVPTWKDRALYDEARVVAKKGDKKRAAEIYKDILAKVPTTPLKDDINSRLALLEATP